MSGDDETADERMFFAEVANGKPTSFQKRQHLKAPNPNAGHRDRLRQRFREAGPQALADYEILELFLFRSIPQKDTKPIAKALLARFGTLSGVLNANPDILQEINGVGASVAFDLTLIRAAAQRLIRTEIKGREILSSWTAVIDYCTAVMAHEDREQFRIIFLDKKNGIIADEVQQTGTVDHTPVYPREVMKRALALSATAIILVHNHPSGDPSPSRADIEMTHKIIEVATGLGIVVHDHIIIGKNGHTSLKGTGLM